MLDFLEIVVCTLAVFGGYTILDMIKERLLYPKRVRSRLRGAVFFERGDDVCALADYARYLCREQKISSGRLIILCKDGIIEEGEELARIGDVFCTAQANIIKCKEIEDDT